MSCSCEEDVLGLAGLLISIAFGVCSATAGYAGLAVAVLWLYPARGFSLLWNEASSFMAELVWGWFVLFTEFSADLAAAADDAAACCG